MSFTMDSQVVCVRLPRAMRSCVYVSEPGMDSPEDSEPQQSQGTRLTDLLLTSAEVVQN